MARIKTVSRTQTQTELAKLLEVSQSSVAEAKRRQSIPADWYLKLFEKLGVNPDWLKKGNGPVYLRTEAGYVPSDGDWRNRRLPRCTPCAATARKPPHQRRRFNR